MSKREEEKAVEATKRVAEQAKSVADKQVVSLATLQEIRQQETIQQFQESINASLNETKKNVKKSIDEAKNQIPRYADVVKNYQEQALESTGKMTDDYMEAQKSIINSVFDSSIPYYENVQRMYNNWLSPRSTNGAMGKISQQYRRKYFSIYKNK